MVQHIEGFQPKSQIQTLVDGEDTGDLSVELVVCGASEGVPANIAIRSIARAGKRAGLLGIWINGAAGCDLSEGSRVQETAVCLPGS